MDVLFGEGSGQTDVAEFEKQFWVMEKMVPVIFLGLPAWVLALIAKPWHESIGYLAKHILRFRWGQVYPLGEG